MAQVQYKNIYLGINKTTAYTHTKRDHGDIDNWFRQARKAIKEIPEPSNESFVRAHKIGWYLYRADADVNFVSFILHDHMDNKAYVIIDRKKDALS